MCCSAQHLVTVLVVDLSMSGGLLPMPMPMPMLMSDASDRQAAAPAAMVVPLASHSAGRGIVAVFCVNY